MVSVAVLEFHTNVGTPSWVRAAAADVAPVPPFATGSVPVTPGVTFALPLKDAVLVLARLVRKVRLVARVVAVLAFPDNAPVMVEPLIVTPFMVSVPDELSIIRDV